MKSDIRHIGVAFSAENKARIVLERGDQPMLIVLAAPEGDDVAVLATTVGLPCPHRDRRHNTEGGLNRVDPGADCGQLGEHRFAISPSACA